MARRAMSSALPSLSGRWPRKVPFADAANQIVIMGWIKDGEREDIPKGVPPAYDAFTQVIEGCWAQDPAARWSLPKAIAVLKSIVVDPGEVPSVVSFTGNLTSM